MVYQTINPYNGEKLKEFHTHTDKEVQEKIENAGSTFRQFKNTSFEERSARMNKLSLLLKQRKEELALLITTEMGKLKKEALAEIEKCAWVCQYYSDNAAEFLAPEKMESSGKSCAVHYEPLGAVLAIMPWNFPFWQLFRFAAPAVMAGNTVLLKHAPNVPQCAEMIASLFGEAGFPEHVVQNIFADNEQAADIIASPEVCAVTLTGSTRAGGEVAAVAGKQIKKTVLELGGSDPFIILDDADIDQAVEVAVKSRLMNAGQSCIAAKRFIIHEAVYDEVCEKMVEAFKQKMWGDPLSEDTTLAPLARPDLVENIAAQVDDAKKKGARCLVGGEQPQGEGCFYEPTVLDQIPEEAKAYTEELFGPVAALYKCASEREMITLANATPYGLGASLWTRNEERAEEIIPQIAAGSVFVNQMTASDPRIPFGGIKKSGYGRELSKHGIKEFVNAKTVFFA